MQVHQLDIDQPLSSLAIWHFRQEESGKVKEGHGKHVSSQRKKVNYYTTTVLISQWKHPSSS